MIQNWRDAWGDPDAKFLIVQLANFQEPAKTPATTPGPSCARRRR
jgi:hypothetical protein